jgi:hypothetical protein
MANREMRRRNEFRRIVSKVSHQLCPATPNVPIAQSKRVERGMRHSDDPAPRLLTRIVGNFRDWQFVLSLTGRTVRSYITIDHLAVPIERRQ